MSTLHQKDLLGFPVLDIPLSHLIDSLVEDLSAGRQIQVVTVNPEMLSRQSYDDDFHRVLHSAEYLVADGSGVVLASRMVGNPVENRIPGIELAEAIFQEADQRGWRIYCLGGTEEALNRAVNKIRERFPGMNLVGWHHGYFTEAEPVLEAVNRSGAEVLLVGLGSPRQEKWIARYRSRLGSRILVGIGGSFDVLGESKKRAPRLFRKYGLEWMWRVGSEPRRMVRVVPAFGRFGWLVLRYRLKKR